MESAVHSQSAKYLLSNHAFLCIEVGGAIFLNLKTDQYIGLPEHQAKQLAGLVSGWPVSPGEVPEEEGSPSGSRVALLGLLIERGLITSNPDEGKDATPVNLQEPTDEIGADSWFGTASISTKDLLDFSWAVVMAALWLRMRSIEKTVRHVQGRKRRTQSTGFYDQRALARAISVFVRLRPFIFTSRDKCLLETLALGEFLSRKGIFPTWVFAVHSTPFSAHCWLQLGTHVLNDTLENVQNFKPIMVV
jgi:hypothetical protein